MNDHTVVNHYAKAFIDSISMTDYQVALEDIAALKSIFSENKILNYFLQSHFASVAQKKEIISIITDNLNLKSIWENLIKLLIKNLRFSLLPEIIIASRNMILNQQGKMPIKLTFSRQQEAETIQSILVYLKNIFHKDIIADIAYDKTIIGGFVAENEDMVIDGSIQNNLQRFIQMNGKNPRE